MYMELFWGKWTVDWDETELEFWKYEINDIVRTLDVFIKFNLYQLMAFFNIASLTYTYNIYIYGIYIWNLSLDDEENLL